MSRLWSPTEWVAPLVPIASLAILPLGPLFFPRTYLIVLFTYFILFLYTQINHVRKFWLTSRKIKATIRKWNERFNHKKDDVMNSEEEKLHYLDDPHFYHAFILPNYCEHEDLLKDTIDRLASHRYFLIYLFIK